ncbi:MAG: Tll0287-like domain-containing protein [Pseudomonadota bacterium]
MSASKLILKFFIIFIAFSATTSLASDNKTYETAAKKLQQRLGKVLMSTIQSDGHIAAIDVCNEQAPEIASTVGEELGLVVSRTALKVRNPDNKPSAEQKRVLEDFEYLWERNKGKPPSTTYMGSDGHEVWMKAIVMQPQCAACHGNSVAPELKRAINERYPNDQATGFEVGEIRGAFVVRSKNKMK